MEQFLKQEKVKMSRYDITSAYMIVGGIPYYLGYFEPGKSLAQSVDRMFFDKDAKLGFAFDTFPILKGFYIAHTNHYPIRLNQITFSFF